MKKLIVAVLLLLLSLRLFCQDIESSYRHAISIEHSYIPGIFLYGAFIPDNIEYGARISNRVYLQGGIFAQNADEIPGETFFTEGFALYAGGTMKFYLFKKAYFTPSVNLYFDFYGNNNILYNWSLTIGPTVAFEYFLSERISLRLDVINVNVGIGFPNNDLIGTVHRLAGVGVKYNFNF